MAFIPAYHQASDSVFKVAFRCLRMPFRCMTCSNYTFPDLSKGRLPIGQVPLPIAFLSHLSFSVVILNLIPYIPIDHFQVDFWVFIDGLLPPGTHQFFSDIFFDIAEKRRGSLLSSVFFLSIFLMTNGIMAIFGGFEFSYHIQLTRTYVKQYLYALMVAIILSLLVLLQ